MRSLYFLLPGTTQKFACGGLFAELKTLALAQPICASKIVTYRQREPDTLFLDDVLQQPTLDDVIFVASWGFDVPKLVARLKHHHVLYHAHSAEYGFRLSAKIPIMAVSRNTMGYWGQRSPHSLIYYLPNQISDEFSNFNCDRNIDVLVHTRKSSRYLLHQLIPALQQRCRVCVIDTHVDSLSTLFNRTKVYLYDSAEYWAQQGVSEGFGLQPMEAIACGCQVFSSVNGGLSDYLDPGFNCYKIAGYSTDFDGHRIVNCIDNFAPNALPDAVLNHHRTDAITKRLAVILQEVNEFFDHSQKHPSDIAELTPIRVLNLRSQTLFAKLKKKLRSRG
ncbi:glycosyltransferase [Myxacorys almedinensis]|uniref:Glycosyltransferase n=1 Tax=Myxacorys almedinensis A TaxID=2690445 RepID=A0A8J8CK40_9CYAN|nr:glycosyltransferase [Myxacorys almedinensis]NDJ16250.1 glycosyltransferase [Myxacorys almedinensis A]